MICHCQQFRACPFKYLTANAHYQCSKQAGKQIVFRPVLKQKFSQACSKQLWYVNTPWKTLFSMLIFSQACSKQFWYVNTPWKTLFSVLILSIAAAVKWCYCWLFHASHTLTPLHPELLRQSDYTDFSVAERMCDIGILWQWLFCVPTDDLGDYNNNGE